VDIVPCVVEQRSLYESYVKCGSVRKWRKFRRKFPGKIVPRTRGIHKLIKKFRSTGSLLDWNPARKRTVLTEEKLNAIESTK
jgi:hypothetical protein